MKRVFFVFIAVCILLPCLLLQSCTLDTVLDSLPKRTLSAEELYRKASPSVVEIWGNAKDGSNQGTGFFYDTNGTVITNYHVIENCSSASITLSSGATYEVVKVLGYNVSEDIAILGTSCSNSTPLEIRETAVKTGETVYAIGSSLGLSGTLSSGIISAADREVDGYHFIQTTAPVSQGNSGGPLLDKSGRVVGIVSATISAGQNLNLAIPISALQRISKSNPTTLAALFPRNVTWLSNREFFYYKEYNKFVLLFQLSDQDRYAMSSSGWVDIKIVNGQGTTVYNQTHAFDESNFGTWIYEGGVERYLASISIKAYQIASGNTSKGTVYFTIYGSGYYFSESTLTASNLPIK